jgi:hypothetical protein
VIDNLGEFMNLYLLSQDDNNDYDTFDSCVVSAESEDAARLIKPGWSQEWGDAYSTWCKSPDRVAVTLIGTAIEGTEAGQVICASFNAG